MPKNKNASFRYRVINNCLKNKFKKWTIDDLISEVERQMYEQFGIDSGISKRTIQYDINIMRSEAPRGFSAPILCENGYYSYENENYSIENNPLNITDIENLREAANNLKQFLNLPFYKDLNSMLLKLDTEISSEKEQFIYFENNENLKNYNELENLFKALKSKKVINFKYEPFNKNEIEIILNPYLLKEYRNRWFIIGNSPNFKNYSVLAIDRIKSYSITDIDTNFDLKPELLNILNNIIGVTLPANSDIEKIDFWVDNKSANYLRTKPIHHSQTILEENENGILFQITLILNYELEQIFLSFGENLKILSPEGLREKFKLRVIKLNTNYQ